MLSRKGLCYSQPQCFCVQCFPLPTMGSLTELMHRHFSNVALFSSADWWTTSHGKSGKWPNFSFSISTKSWRELGVLGSSWITDHKNKEKQGHWKEGLSFLSPSPVVHLVYTVTAPIYWITDLMSRFGKSSQEALMWLGFQISNMNL